jgi:hypothetical protein
MIEQQDRPPRALLNTRWQLRGMIPRTSTPQRDRKGRGDGMAHRHTTDIVLIILAVIGAIAGIALLGMWLMHATMMGGVMGGCCGVTGVGFWLIGLLILAGAVAAVAILLRHKPRP